MHAAVVERIEDDPLWGEAPEPRRAPGQALIEVRAAALNPLDLAIASGRYYGGTPKLPYVPGIEGVGTVLEGENLEPGTRVRFEVVRLENGQPSRYGSFAERTVVDEAAVIRLPDATPDALAACLGAIGWAGWLSVEWRAQLAAGERVLVLGATGAVGRIAVQAARLLGASVVVAAGRSRAALAEMRELGADAVVELDERQPDELAAAFTEAAAGPPDVVVDTLWGRPALAAIMAAGVGARVVNLGQSAGPTLELTSGLVRGKMISLLGYANHLVPMAERRRTFGSMIELSARGELKVGHEVRAMEGVADAWREQRTSPHRKLVLTVR